MRKTLAILGVAASISTLTACGGSHYASNKNPSSLIGEWHQTNSNSDGWMTASISAGSIQVDLRGRDSRSIFWMGSFDTDRKPVGKFKVVSIPDPDARYIMKKSLMASNELKKTFVYNNGDLSFEFSMAGTSKTIHLSKTITAKPTRTITSPPTFNRPTGQTTKTYSPKPAPTKTTKSAVLPKTPLKK